MSIAGLRAQLASLAPPPPAADTTQVLKQVTILFLDVVGSTTLSQHLDPEAISAVMDDALSRGTSFVQAHRGRVLQYAGDNILAAFGADEAREDDVERAVHCGLALRDLGKTLGAEVLAAHNYAGFNVRVGLHTGGVLLGGGVDADGSIRGIAVNVAARMEQTAPAGALRISHATYAQVRGLFEVDAQPPLAVKGVDTPIQSYLVLRAKPRHFRIGTRGIEGVATRMIGRDAELEALQNAFKQLFAQRRLAAVTVVGDAGLGKSRLLYEFEAWSEARPESFFLFRGRATPGTASQAFGLLRDILAWRFQILDDDSVQAARQKMEAGIVPLFLHDDGPDQAEAHAHLLGHLIGIEWTDSRHIKGILDDPKQIRNRAFHAAAQFFRRIGAAGTDRGTEPCNAPGATPDNGTGAATPVILQLDDLHWADSESLNFLNYLVEVNRDVPMLVLALARPTLFEQRTDWLVGPGHSDGMHRRIDLTPLDKTGSRMLASELLKQLPEIPAALRELITSSAEGNPFYMEELVKMLIDQGAIQIAGPDGLWSVNAERLLLTHVPPTLTGVLQARLDSLPAVEKRALQQASVIGAVFWDQALAAVDTEAAGQLPALTRRELTLPRADAALEGVREYAFRHQVLHQVTYDTVLKRHKREGHAKVAQWLAGLAGQGSLRAGDLLGTAAEHFEQAGDIAQAAEFHIRAAEHAGTRLAHDRVLMHVDRATALLNEAAPTDHALRWRMLSVRERTLDLQSRRDEQGVDLDELAKLANELDDDRRRSEVAWRLAGRAMRMGDWATQETAAREAMSCAMRTGDDRLRLLAIRALSLAHINQGDFELGRELCLHGLADARRVGLRDSEAVLLNTLAIAADVQGDLVGSMEFKRQSLQGFRDTGNRVNEAIVLSNIALSSMRLGDLVQAQRDLESALHMARSNGDKWLEGSALCPLSSLALWQGDETAALALAHSAVAITAAARAGVMEVNAILCLGAAELALGRLDAARWAYREALQHGLKIDSPLQYEACAGLAKVALAQGDTAEALAAMAALLDRQEAYRPGDGIADWREIELTCYRVLAQAADLRATDWLGRAHRALMAQADSIAEVGVREGFLKNIPRHSAIVDAWAQSGLASDKPRSALG